MTMCQFDAEEAAMFGVNEAIILADLRSWINKNKANGRHFYDGRFWAYSTVEAFTKLFSFWNSNQIRRILASLENQGVLLSGNFNERPKDRTKWYAIREDRVSSVGQLDPPKGVTGKYLDEARGERLKHFDRFWESYPKRRGSNPKTPARKKFLSKLSVGHDPEKITAAALVFAEWCRKELKEHTEYVPMAVTWLNQERYQDTIDVDPPTGTGKNRANHRIRHDIQTS